MNMINYDEIVLGIDIGTTGIKTLAVDKHGNIIGRGYKEYELITRPGGIVEQNANDWINGVIVSVRQVVDKIKNKYKVTALSLSTQGASMTAVDNDNKPLCNVITWMDSRADMESNHLNKTIGKENLYHKTGYLTGASSDSTKILWLKNNHSEIDKNTYKYVSTIEYVNYFLTGKYIIDPSNAGIRGMFNINDLTWDDEIIDVIGINKNQLPEVHSSGEFIGKLSSNASNLLNLDTDVNVYNGAHDQYCAAVGCGALNKGDMLLSTGTTWVILGINDKITYNDSYICAGIHPVKNLYGALSSLKNGGSALKWLKELISADSYIEIDNAIDLPAKIKTTSNLYFSPFLNGAGFPHKEKDMLSGIYGLQLHHDKYDLALALMECIAFEIKTALNEYSSLGINVKKLKMVGGAAKSNLWTKITSYVTDCEIICMKESEACALGAAIIAGVGVKLFDNYDFRNNTEKVISDNVDIKNYYREKYDRYAEYLDYIKNYTNNKR